MIEYIHSQTLFPSASSPPALLFLVARADLREFAKSRTTGVVGLERYFPSSSIPAD